MLNWIHPEQLRTLTVP